MRRSPRPIVITAATAFLSCGLLALAVWRGWLGLDVGRGATFCEAARSSVVRQPANTFSNAGFVIAGLLMMRGVRNRADDGAAPPDVSWRAAGEGLRFVFSSPLIENS